MSWYSVVSRILGLLVLAVPIGLYYGHPIEVVLLVLAGVLGFWLMQLRLVQNWLEDPTQPPPDVHGIFGDILARIYRHQRIERDTQAQLQSTADFFRESFASLRDGVVIINEVGNIEWANKAAERITGLSYPLDRGQTVYNLIRQPEFHDYLELAEHTKPLTYCADSELGLYLMLEVSQFGEGDKLLFFRDVSTLIKTDQMRRDFIGNISHELRTPLTVITGYLGAFLDDSDNVPLSYQKPLEQMVQQSERMENLLKDLLWLSRIESEELREKDGTVNVAGLLEEMLAELRGIYPDRVFKSRIESQNLIVGDYRELQSAVSNLIFNAIKYSPDESAVEVNWTSDEGGLARLSVRDHGLGIDEIHIPRLTERFYRVDDSRNSATGGTGLGLAIVKHVAVSHSAELIISSEVGKGSIFTLIFPALPDNSSYESTRAPAAGLPNQENSNPC